jgi:hypothetical protein
MSSRLALVAAIWVLVMGGTALFLRLDTPGAGPRPLLPRPETVTGDHALEITTSFALAPDPFALTADADQGRALTVRLSGRIVHEADAMPPEGVLRISPIPGLLEGANEFHVQATPPADQGDRPEVRHALRLRFLRGAEVVAERTFWAARGAPVSGSLHVLLEQEQ